MHYWSFQRPTQTRPQGRVIVQEKQCLVGEVRNGGSQLGHVKCSPYSAKGNVHVIRKRSYNQGLSFNKSHYRGV